MVKNPYWLDNNSARPSEFKLANQTGLELVCFAEHEVHQKSLVIPFIFDQPDLEEEVRAQSLEL